MKRFFFSPVACLVMSLSLALGILVGDMGGLKLLTTAHAEDSTCSGMVYGQQVTLEEGVAVSGIAVRDIYVNGQLVPEAVIAGRVQLVDSSVVNALGVIVGGNEVPNGVIVGGREENVTPCGVIVGGNEVPNGVIVGGNEVPNGVIVGGREVEAVSLSGATVNASGTAVGGELTGDGITINDGVITGQNLLLSGTTIDGGSISGTTEGISVPPSN